MRGCMQTCERITSEVVGIDLVLAIPHTRVFGIWGRTGFRLIAPVQFVF